MHLRVAVVGIGAMGSGIIRTLKKMRGIEIVAIADKNPEALTRIQSVLPSDTMVTTYPGYPHL